MIIEAFNECQDVRQGQDIKYYETRKNNGAKSHYGKGDMLVKGYIRGNDNIIYHLNTNYILKKPIK